MNSLVKARLRSCAVFFLSKIRILACFLCSFFGQENSLVLFFTLFACLSLNMQFSKFCNSPKLLVDDFFVIVYFQITWCSDNSKPRVLKKYYFKYRVSQKKFGLIAKFENCIFKDNPTVHVIRIAHLMIAPQRAIVRFTKIGFLLLRDQMLPHVMVLTHAKMLPPVMVLAYVMLFC